jgi:tetrahydromethanopterin S-methyltransferase subunit C
MWMRKSSTNFFGGVPSHGGLHLDARSVLDILDLKGSENLPPIMHPLVTLIIKMPTPCLVVVVKVR